MLPRHLGITQDDLAFFPPDGLTLSQRVPSPRKTACLDGQRRRRPLDFGYFYINESSTMQVDLDIWHRLGKFEQAGTTSVTSIQSVGILEAAFITFQHWVLSPN
jgi:hypothetical protein